MKLDILLVFIALLNMSKESFEYLLQIREYNGGLEPETEFVLQAILALAED